MNRPLDALLADLTAVADDDALRRLVAGYLAGHGFEGFIFSVNGESHTHVMCSCGQDLYMRYQENDYHLVDPISRQARSSWLPVTWDVRDYLTHCNRDQVRLFESTLEHGYERGISAPVRGPLGGYDIFVGLSRQSEREFSRGKQLWKNEFMLIGAYMSSAYHSVLHPAEGSEAELTRRELECLYWTAQGKTAWEVSRLLDVSERTVQFHIRNACAKLNAVSKHQATLRAASRGLIRV